MYFATLDCAMSMPSFNSSPHAAGPAGHVPNGTPYRMTSVWQLQFGECALDGHDFCTELVECVFGAHTRQLAKPVSAQSVRHLRTPTKAAFALVTYPDVIHSPASPGLGRSQRAPGSPREYRAALAPQSGVTCTPGGGIHTATRSAGLSPCSTRYSTCRTPRPSRPHNCMRDVRISGLPPRCTSGRECKTPPA
jgi:hypothetical protein